MNCSVPFRSSLLYSHATVTSHPCCVRLTLHDTIGYDTITEDNSAKMLVGLWSQAAGCERRAREQQQQWEQQQQRSQHRRCLAPRERAAAELLAAVLLVRSTRARRCCCQYECIQLRPIQPAVHQFAAATSVVGNSLLKRNHPDSNAACTVLYCTCALLIITSHSTAQHSTELLLVRYSQ